jgi:hypothetical protein
MKTKTKTKESEQSKITIVWDDELKTTADEINARLEAMRLIAIALLALNVVILIGAIFHR